MAQHNKKFDNAMIKRIPTIRLTDAQSDDLEKAFKIEKAKNFLLTPTDFCRNAILLAIEVVLDNEKRGNK